ncbi:MAG: hypothetical protein J2P45_02970 [Candidatus Dormibacteraeota bacterium]|nr:hypothetical protein [Candidatus Dormibacteraeota bacterium]
MSSQLVDGDTASQVRRAIELIEQAPAEALYAKLLESLSKAGAEADLRGSSEISSRIAFAYKLAVELGGKLNVLPEEDLAWRRRLAAQLFGEG